MLASGPLEGWAQDLKINICRSTRERTIGEKFRLDKKIKHYFDKLFAVINMIKNTTTKEGPTELEVDP